MSTESLCKCGLSGSSCAADALSGCSRACTCRRLCCTAEMACHSAAVIQRGRYGDSAATACALHACMAMLVRAEACGGVEHDACLHPRGGQTSHAVERNSGRCAAHQSRDRWHAVEEKDTWARRGRRGWAAYGPELFEVFCCRHMPKGSLLESASVGRSTGENDTRGAPASAVCCDDFAAHLKQQQFQSPRSGHQSAPARGER